MIEKALVAFLLGSPAITALVGTRITPLASVPQGSAWPRLTFVKVSDRDISFSNLGRGTLWEARIQFDAWGEDALQSLELGELVIVTLSPRRALDAPNTDLCISSSCLVHSGRVAQRLPLAAADIPVPNKPNARPQRDSIDITFQYTKTQGAI